MNPAGIIITYIDWSNWKQWWFNIPLFLFQLTFMVVGTAIGKIRWSSRRLNWIDVIILWALTTFLWLVPRWWNTPLIVVWLFVGFAIFRGIPWAVVWRAAQASHVRLCLKKDVPEHPDLDIVIIPTNDKWDRWQYINFGYPEAKLDYWRLDQCDGKRFEYRDPMFTFPQERIDSMIQYAEDQVGKKYDWLQLLSPPANFPIWIIYPPKWGKEVIGWFNLPGGREFCSSGDVAILLWYGESFQATEDKRITDGNRSEFFGTYDPAVIPPCLIVISEKWRKVE